MNQTFPSEKIYVLRKHAPAAFSSQRLYKADFAAFINRRLQSTFFNTYIFSLRYTNSYGEYNFLICICSPWNCIFVWEYNVCCMTCCHMVLYMTGCHKSTCFSTIFFSHHSASIVKRFLLNKRKQGGAMFFALSCFLILSYLFFFDYYYV